ncbi:MAG: hypothetical protein EHM93_16555 [Bacteroidales bacterium]|nr:MAG: hypothetical protein EHM93_16555 [Bacteroidales bacterium]
MKAIKKIILFVLVILTSLNSYSQAHASLIGKKISVHKIDDKYGPFQGNMGYSYSDGINGKLDIKIDSGKHSIEFLPWYNSIEYKLIFVAEKDKTYEILKPKSNSEKPQIIESKTGKPVAGAVIVEVVYTPAGKNDKVFHLFKGNMEQKSLAVLSLEPEYFDIIPIVYKMDDTWGPITAGCMRRFNKFKLGGGDMRGAMEAMSFTIELAPGEHTLEYSFHSNKVKFSIKGGLTTMSDSYEVYKLNFNFESGKFYTFKFVDSQDPSSLVIVEK